MSGRTKEMLYLPQEISEEQKLSILDDFYKLDEAERGEVLSTLFRLGSEPENINQQQLSPGELRKLMIALAIQKPLSLLIMDEPTNHMDITSVLALENALASLNCAMLVVSHDQSFLDKITNMKLVAERTKESNGVIKL